MAGLDDHLKDPLYANWVRNTLALNFVNSVLQPYVYGEVVKLQKSIISRCPAGVTCGSCSWRQATRCPNNFCNIIKNEIKDNHRYGDPSFDNTNARDWKSDAWEVAKCFMPVSKGNRECTSSDADFSAIVNIVINCKAFDELVLCDLDNPRNIFSQARILRNDLMHSKKLEISKYDIQSNLDLLMSILNDIKTKPTNFTEALDKITELKAGRLEITLQDVLDARTQFLLKNGATKEDVAEQIAKLRQEIKEGASIWKVSQHRLIDNFVNGSKYALVKIMESHINKVKPERCPKHKWNFSKFLVGIEVYLEIQLLPERHRLVLYPDDDVTADIHDLDLFLLCYILSIESIGLLDNDFKAYIKKLIRIRDKKILGNPPNIAVTDLENLAECLQEPLRTEIKNKYYGEGIIDGALKLQFELTSWQRNEDTMENKQIGIKTFQQMKEMIQRADKNRAEFRRQLINLCKLVGNMIKWQNPHPEHKEQIDQLHQDFKTLVSRLNNEEDINSIDTQVEIQINESDPEEEELIQSNMTSEDPDDNIALAGGGMSQLQEELDLDIAKIAKGSTILKVTCKSVKDVIRFWDSCMDGSAARAMSKIRDDYRKHFGCGSLEFAIVLTKNEVQRCMNYLVEKMSSRLLDDNTVKEIQAKVAMLQMGPVKKMPSQLLDENTVKEIQAKETMLQTVPATMTVLGDRLKNPHFANWVGNTLALEITNGVLRPYVNQEIIKMHSQIVSKFPPGTTCKSCDWKQADSCSKNICNVVKKKIKDSHRFSNPSFKNTNASMCLDDYWEIAKCFMPPTRRNENCTSTEADFSAVVNIIINDRNFDALVSCDLDQSSNIFHKASVMRNNLMHPSAYKVGDSDFQSNLNVLINVLNDFVGQLPKKQEAIEQLNRLKTGKLQIKQQHINDAIEQVVRALQEESDRGKDEIKRCVKEEIDKIQGCSQQRILKAKFVECCKYSLLKLVEGDIASLKPPNVVEDEWTFSRYLDRMEYIPDIATLPDRYKRLLYPDLGKAQDVSNWDLFLLCHVLLVQKSNDPLPNSLVNYITELKHKRDDILDKPADVKIESLGELTEYLDEPLRSEVKAIFMSSSEYSNEDPLQLQNTLQSWRHYDVIMENRPASDSDLQCFRHMHTLKKKTELMRKRMEEMLVIDPPSDTEDEGLNDNMGTEIEIVAKNCSRTEKEKL